MTAATLLIVGGADPEAIRSTGSPSSSSAARRLEIVAGAGHLFEERGALERVAIMTREWFLGPPDRERAGLTPAGRRILMQHGGS